MFFTRKISVKFNYDQNRFNHFKMTAILNSETTIYYFERLVIVLILSHQTDSGKILHSVFICVNCYTTSILVCSYTTIAIQHNFRKLRNCNVMYFLWMKFLNQSILLLFFNYRSNSNAVVCITILIFLKSIVDTHKRVFN